MIHAREDYNRIQDPENKIPKDEPVFLLRATDVVAPNAILAWADLAKKIGASDDIIEMAKNHAALMIEWQMANGYKIPDL